MGQRVKPPVQPLRYVNFIKVIFRPIKRLSNVKLVSEEVRKLLFCVVKRDRLPLSPSQYSVCFALRQSRVDLMTFQTINQNLHTSQELDSFN